MIQAKTSHEVEICIQSVLLPAILKMGQSVRSTYGFKNCHSIFDCKYPEADVHSASASTAPVEQRDVTCCCRERFQVGLALILLSEKHKKENRVESSVRDARTVVEQSPQQRLRWADL